MSERTALEIALELDAASCSSFVKLEAAEALRKQQAEVERLTKQNAAYRTLNSAQSKQLEFHRSKDAEYQEAIATIDSERAANEMLTAERDAAIANVSALTQHLTQVIGDHNAPSDCFSSGPMFGDPRDAICPACAALHFLSNPRASVDSGRDAAISAAVAAEREANAILTAEREARAAEIDSLKRERHHIYDLLARIHRDGGQYAAEHGVEKACEDAESQVAAWLDTISEVDALIEQARIAKSEACARICEKSLSREEAAYLIRAGSAK